MSATCSPYPLTYRHLGRARVDLLTADLRLALVTSAYSPAPGDEWFSDAQAAETSGPGYTAGGQALDNVEFDFDTEAGRAVLTCDPVTFDEPAFTARYGVIYAATGDPGTSPLLAYLDPGADLTADGGEPLVFTFTPGVLRLGPVTTT